MPGWLPTLLACYVGRQFDIETDIDIDTDIGTRRSSLVARRSHMKNHNKYKKPWIFHALFQEFLYRIH